jgi:hypothetical protein
MAESHFAIEVRGLSARYPAGTCASFSIIVSSEAESAGSLLEGGSIGIEDSTDTVITNALLTKNPTQDASLSFTTSPLSIAVPLELGEHFYLIKCYPSPNAEGTMSAAALPVAQAYLVFESVGHRVGMSVWGPISPVMSGELFEVCVGIQCDGHCEWEGAQGSIWEEEHLLHSFTLSRSTKAKEDEAFFTAALGLPAPQTIGVHQWRFEINAQATGVPHSYAARSLSFAVCGASLSKTDVRVLDDNTGLPIPGALITVIAADGLTYRAKTDSQGIVQLGLPSGDNEIRVRKKDYKTHKSHFLSEESGNGGNNEPVTVNLRFFPE